MRDPPPPPLKWLPPPHDERGADRTASMRGAEVMWGDERVLVSGTERTGLYTGAGRGADAERNAGPALEKDEAGRDAYVGARFDVSTG